MGADGKIRSFTLPSQLADVPGTDGWQSMYPYYTRFQPEDDQRFWFYNAMHFPEPMPAFDAITAEIPNEALGRIHRARFCVSDDDGHRASHRQRPHLHYGEPGH